MSTAINVSHVLDGIEAELEQNKKPLRVEIAAIQPLPGGLARLRVEAPRPLDESLEGARAWWPRPGGRGGSAEVLSLVPEQEQLDLWQLSTSLPAVGEAIFLYPPLYLEPLRKAWSNPDWARRAQEHALRGAEPAPLDLGPAGFPRLRARQLEAWGLVGWRSSFLHGPPGTGKTTTLGALTASLLARLPEARVLLLSTTNGAVDEALFSVDRGLTHLGVAPADRRCKRVGVRFEGTRYQGASHLLPPVDRALLGRRAALERSRPLRDDAAAYAAWRLAMDEVQRGLRQHLLRVAREARLIALTTTHAAFVLDALRELPPFDLLLIDEASQVGQAHALGLAPLASRVLHAGDPKQLGPVVQSEHPMARRWLRSSMFRWAEEGPRSVFLDEQSRMAPAICSLVSNVFYNGQLRVAADASSSPRWLQQRLLPASPGLDAPFHVERVDEAGDGPTRGPGGSVARPASARALVAWALRLTRAGLDPQDLLVLTPFRAQRSLLLSLLRDQGLGAVQVSTVHRAQGRERHSVLYDPVDGSSEFLQGDEARRLLNVALSRAQARLVVFLSPRDLATNSLLAQVAAVASGASASAALALLDVVARPGFPARFRGTTVEHRGRRLTIGDLSEDRRRLRCLDLDSGQERLYDLEALRKPPPASP